MKNTNLYLFLSLLLNCNIYAQDATPTPAPSIPTVVLDETTTYWINNTVIRVRPEPSLNSKSLGELYLNDQVKVINPSVIYDNKFVEIKIVKTTSKINSSEKYFVAVEFLAPKKVDFKEFTSNTFVVVNVATETLRVYERQCGDNSCPHKMIFETEVVVGEDVDHPAAEKGKGRSVLGSYRIVGWSKFYQDGEGHYPAWYRDGYPLPPAPSASWRDWFSKEFMPKDEKGKRHGEMRGAFGWYTAFVEPEAFNQWTHGTLGWGSDKDTFIKRVKKPLINVVSNPRSSGCTRNNNEAIAYLRKLTQNGTPIVKIYAKEEVLDPTYSSYPEQEKSWDYVLTTNRNHAVDKNEVLTNLKINEDELKAFWDAKKSGGELILAPNSSLNQILEVGTYTMDVHPDAISYTDGEKLGRIERAVGRKGNVYGVKSKNMFGTFYVDAGLLKDYQHPTETLEVSGFADEITPSWMNISNLK